MPTPSAPHGPQQMDFPSLAFAKGRTVLYLFEVAGKLGITTRHVGDLIEEGKLEAIDISGKNSSDRKHWRVPIEAYNRYIDANRSSK